MSTAPSAVRAGGRVNLIGEHTDYTGGLAVPMAIDQGTTVRVHERGDLVHLTSDHDPRPAVVRLDVTDASTVEPPWARYVAGVVAELRPAVGITGTVTSDLPIGAGLSSSASLEIAVATALGFDGSPLALAQLCQRAEQRAAGVPCGLMDQLAIACGTAGAALLLDCTSLTVQPLPLPVSLTVVAVHSGQSRRLVGSEYARRRAECAAAEELVGPLRSASREDVERLTDPLLRRRARHVVTENARVRDFVAALLQGDVAAAGHLVDQSHRSLRDDFAVSTPTVDELVERLRAVPGVRGARMTGAGFGGMVIGVCDAGVPLPAWLSGATLRAATGVTRP